jgi:uroporphyrinogen decarboxylase
MTAKERWQTIMRGGSVDRPVCDYWGTGEITQRLLADLHCRDERQLWETLGVDKCVFLAPRHPQAKENTWHIPSLYSIWGVETVHIPYMDGTGEYEEPVNPPLAPATTVPEVENYPWPDPAEFIYDELPSLCDEWRDCPIVGASYEPFFLYCRLRGMEQSLEDLVMNPDIVDATMERIYEIHAGIVRRVAEKVKDKIDFIYVAEDLGTQNSLLMSPNAFRRHVKPWLRKMIELTHSYGLWAFHHDDGAIRPLLPDLIEIGVDVLNPIQWRCKGMEREALATDFGKDLVFHGGVDNQQTLPFGTPADVAQQVRENLAAFAPCKGYVVAPCHNLQANTPTANVVAMYEAAHR